MTEHYFCMFVIGALLGINYGLINRLIKQAGSYQMNAKAAMDKIVRDTIGAPSDDREPVKAYRQVKESFRIGV